MGDISGKEKSVQTYIKKKKKKKKQKKKKSPLYAIGGT